MHSDYKHVATATVYDARVLHCLFLSMRVCDVFQFFSVFFTPTHPQSMWSPSLISWVRRQVTPVVVLSKLP